MLLRGLFASMIFGLIAVSGQPAAAATAPLAGSWQITLNPTGATPPIPAAVPGLVTFTSDGAVIETDGLQVVPRPGSSATAPVLFGTPGHGAWSPGPAFTNYVASFVSLRVSPNATLHGASAYQFIVKVDPVTDQLRGTFSLTQTAANGQVTTLSGAVTGVRILTPPLP